MRMNFTCRICGSTGLFPIHSVREMMFGTRETFDYFECTACSCLQISEIPSDPGTSYPDDYYAFSRPRLPSFLGLRRALNRIGMDHALGNRTHAGRAICHLYGDQRLPSWPLPARLSLKDHILDVGCGNGKRLLQLYTAGFEHLTGIDPYIPGDICYAEGVTVLKRSLDQVAGSFDCIVLHHSFEHMPDPKDVLKRLHGLLSPNRFLVLRIPVFPSYAWRTYGTDWIQLDAPRHLFLYSRKSLEVLANATGFRIEQVVFDSMAMQFLGSAQYRRDIAHTDPESYVHGFRKSIFTRSEVDKYRELASSLNAKGDGDQAIFYLRREDG